MKNSIFMRAGPALFAIIFIFALTSIETSATATNDAQQKADDSEIVWIANENSSDMIAVPIALEPAIMISTGKLSQIEDAEVLSENVDATRTEQIATNRGATEQWKIPNFSSVNCSLDDFTQREEPLGVKKWPTFVSTFGLYSGLTNTQA